MDNEMTTKTPYVFSIPETARLIKVRVENDELFDGKRNGAKAAWSLILREMGLEGKATTEQVAKKWDNLKRKYRELKCAPPGTGTDPVSWYWFGTMDKIFGHKYFSPQGTPTVDEPSPSRPAKKQRLLQLGDTLDLMSNGLVLDNPEGDSPSPSGVRTEIGVDGTVRAMKPLDADLDAELENLRRERQEMERDQGEMDRERQALGRERELLERERVAVKRDKAQLEKDWANVEQDRAAVERDKRSLERQLAALERDKLELTVEIERLKPAHGKHDSDNSEGDSTTLGDRQKLRSLFEKLIEKF